MTYCLPFAASFLILFGATAWAGLDVPPAVVDTSLFAKKTDVPALSPVQAVTGQTGSVATPTVCGNSTIPAGNTVVNTAAESSFSTACVIKSPMPAAGNATHLHVGGLYNAGTAQSARGRIRINQTGAPNIASDTAVIDTGSVGGLAAATNQEWFGDVWITFQAGGTSIDVQGALTFQSGSMSVVVPVGNVSTFTVDPTKDLTFYVTVQWGAASALNSMQLRTMVAK